MKVLQTCLCDRKDLESSFHHCAGPVKPVSASLSAGNVCSCRLHCREGVVKQVQACLSTKKDRESSF